MRPIEFRAWNTKTKVMLDCYKMTPLALHPDLVDKQDGVFVPFHEDLILEQFIGRCDINKQKLFEGDILKHNPEDDDWNDVVVWWPEKLKFELKSYVGAYNSTSRIKDKTKRCMQRLSVKAAMLRLADVLEDDNQSIKIGNIHQNPELLK